MAEVIFALIVLVIVVVSLVAFIAGAVASLISDIVHNRKEDHTNMSKDSY